MKKILHIITCLVVGALALAGCTRDLNNDGPALMGATRSLAIDLTTGTADAANKEPIRTVRFVVFNDISSASPSLDLNQMETTTGAEKTTFRATLKVRENPDKLIVAIVNEPSAMKSALDNVKHPAELANLSFDLAAALNDRGNPTRLYHSGIPMAGVMRVAVTKSDLSNTADGAAVKGTIQVERVLARVDVYLKNSDNDKPGATTTNVTKVELLRTSKKGYLVRGSYNDFNSQPMAYGRWLTTSDSAYEADTDLSWTASTGTPVDNTLNSGAGLFLCSFYVPEWAYNSSASDALSIRVSGVADSDGTARAGTLSLTLRPDGTTPITAIERNNVYRITGIIPSAVPTPDPIAFTADVLPWNDVPINVDITNYYFRIIPEDTESFWCSYGEKVELRIETNYPGTWRLDPLHPDILSFEKVSGNVTAYPDVYDEYNWVVSERTYAIGTGNATIKMSMTGIYPSVPLTERRKLKVWENYNNELRMLKRVRFSLLTGDNTNNDRIISDDVVAIRRKPIAPYFAKSNVVMCVDENGNKILTFAETVRENTNSKTVTYYDKVTGTDITGTIPPIAANVQGLHFRWGSLVGINNDGTHGAAFNSDHVVFWPEEYDAPDSWLFNKSSDSANIPFMSPGPSSDNLHYFISTYDKAYDATEAKGDICRYISDKGWVKGRWRTPIYQECEVLIAESPVETNGYKGVQYGSWGNYDYVEITDSGVDGKYGFFKLSNAWMVGAGVHRDGSVEIADYNSVIVPTSGERTGIYSGVPTGIFHNPGTVGYFWCATSIAGVNATYLVSGYDYTSVGGGIYIHYDAHSVRCIRDDEYPLPLYVRP